MRALLFLLLAGCGTNVDDITCNAEQQGCSHPNQVTSADGGTSPDDDLGHPSASSDGGADNLDLALSSFDLSGANLAGPDPSPFPADCDLVKQTGCPMGDKCSLSAFSNATVCGVIDTPPIAVGQSCVVAADGNDNCVAGSFCGSFATGVLNLCTQFCNVDSDCTQTIPSGGLAPFCLKTAPDFCSFACNPVNALDGTQGCPSGTACHYAFDDSRQPMVFNELTDCLTPGPGIEGSDCTVSALSCGAGLTCIPQDNGTISFCRKVCNVGSNNGCGAGQTCTLGISDVDIPVQHFGVCLP